MTENLFLETESLFKIVPLKTVNAYVYVCRILKVMVARKPNIIELPVIKIVSTILVCPNTNQVDQVSHTIVLMNIINLQAGIVEWCPAITVLNVDITILLLDQKSSNFKFSVAVVTQIDKIQKKNITFMQELL